MQMLLKRISGSQQITIGISVLLTFCFISFLALQSQVTARSQPSFKPLKVGFLCVGPVSDWGWNHSEEQGRLYLEKVMKGKVETVFAESVYESAESERVMEKMIAQGCKLIFAQSYGYLESVLRVSIRHPDVTFMQLSRFADNKKNIGTYFGLHGEGFYLAGVAAGRMTKSNKLGFVGSHPVPSTLWAINSYALGVHSVNLKAKIKVVWTETWIDPVLEVEAAKGLIDTGIDCLAFDQSDSLPIVKAAESNGIKVSGCYADVHQFAPKQWLTGPNLNWGPFYIKTCQSVIDHTWTNKVNICDIASGGIELAPFGPSVPETIQREVLQLKEKIKAGRLAVFEGPLKDSTGKLQLPVGKKADIHWLSTMNFFVPGIDGNLPKN
jgi:basic membrane protein A and related proteins